MNEASFAQRFAIQAELALKSGSTQLAAVFVLLLGLVAQWPGLAQAIDAIPILKGMGLPIAGFIVVLAARFKPAAGATQIQALAAEVARLKINAVLKERGIEGIPADPTQKSIVNQVLPKAAPEAVAAGNMAVAVTAPPPAPTPPTLTEAAALPGVNVNSEAVFADTQVQPVPKPSATPPAGSDPPWTLDERRVIDSVLSLMRGRVNFDPTKT